MFENLYYQPQQETKEIPDFLKMMDNLPPDPPKEIDPTRAIDDFRVDMFYYNINNLDRLDSNARASFVKANIDTISDHIANATCKYGNALYTKIFLDTYFRVLSSMPVTPLRKLAANRLAYIFKTNWKGTRISQEEREEMNNLFTAITRVVNAPYPNMLENVGIPPEIATELCMDRFASIDEMINAHRVNQVILYTRDPHLMSEQNIIYIYEKLFDQMRYLFMATMFDIRDNYEHEYADSEDAFYYVFANIGLAVLTMVNNMTMDNINQIITIYVNKWNQVNRPMTRFSLRTLSADFSRIQAVVESMIKNGVYVP